MDQSDRFAASEEVVCREVGGELILLNLSSGLYFGLNEVGARVWEALDEKACSLAEICDCVTEAFEVEREVAEQDIRDLLSALIGQDLLVQVDS